MIDDITSRMRDMACSEKMTAARGGYQSLSMALDHMLLLAQHLSAVSHHSHHLLCWHGPLSRDLPVAILWVLPGEPSTAWVLASNSLHPAS